MKLMHKALVLAAMTFAANHAVAADATGTFTSTFEVLAGCTAAVDGVAGTLTTIADPNVEFGEITQTATKTVTELAAPGAPAAVVYAVSCGNNAAYTLSFGTSDGSTFFAADAPVVRSLTRTNAVAVEGAIAAADLISYNLFAAAGGTGAVLGNNAFSGDAVPGSPTTGTHNVFAYIDEAAQSFTKNVGTYTDIVPVRLSYN